MQSSSAQKVECKRYVGNLPAGMTTDSLVRFLNDCLRKMDLVAAEGDPVTSCWISSDGHYAFVECRTVEEANSLFNLAGINIKGMDLKIGKPREQAQLSSNLATAGSLLGMKNLTNSYIPIDEKHT